MGITSLDSDIANKHWPCIYNVAPASTANSWAVGQTIPFSWEIKFVHDGTCGLRLWKKGVTYPLDPLTNHPQGEKLVDDFPCGRDYRAADYTEPTKDIVIPSSASDCVAAGDCWIQWIWIGNQADQNYANCVDFVATGGSGGDPDPTTTQSPAIEPTTTQPFVAQPTASQTPDANQGYGKSLCRRSKRHKRRKIRHE
jgi:hypothetical protein